MMEPVPSLPRLGNFQLGSRLGPDGVFESYRARYVERGTAEADEGETFVVKVLRADRLQQHAYAPLASRFLAAGRRSLAAQPADVGRVVAMGDEKLGAFVARRFVPGVDLAGLLAAAQQAAPTSRGLDPAVVVVVGTKIARGLAATHAARPAMCHLGLCPGNVVVTPTGEVAVLDFGLFASVRGLFDHPVEKWAFVAPELLGVAIGSQTRADVVAVDIYSLGALLRFLLLGRASCQSRSLAELSERIEEPLRDVPGVPPRLCAAIDAMMARAPADRPHSAGEAGEWLAGKTADARPPVVEQAAPDENQRDHAGSEIALPALVDRRPVVSRVAPAGVASRRSAIAVKRDGVGRPGWLFALLALLGVLVVIVFSVLAFRLTRSFAAKRAAQGVAIAQHRSGEAPPVALPPKALARRRVPEAWLPATPTPPSDQGAAGPADAGSRRAADNDPIPVFPAGRFVIEDSARPARTRTANHLFVDTQPHDAQVWVDGEWKGKTPIDVLVGPGGKQLVIVAAGHHILREAFDASEGTIIRRALASVPSPVRGDAFINVDCRTEGRYPVFIDEVETGLLCPTSRVPVPAGIHHVAVFVPRERKLIGVEVTVASGPKPVEVRLAP